MSGWSNGKVEVRRALAGDVVFRTHVSGAVAALLSADFRLDGKEALVVAAVDGEVKGFVKPEPHEAGERAAAAGDMSEETLVELTQRKQELLFELSRYESGMRGTGQGEGAGAAGGATDYGEMVPKDTDVKGKLESHPERGCVELVLESTNEAAIKMVVIFAEQLFAEESYVRLFPVPTPVARVPLLTKKDTAVDVMAKVRGGALRPRGWVGLQK